MPCCSEIKRSNYIKSPENILDYAFKTTFVIASSLLITIIFPLKLLFYSVNILYSSLTFFNKKFLRDIHSAIINLNSGKANCWITCRLHLVSPQAGGFLYRNFGYILVVIIISVIILGAVFYVH